MNYFVHPQAICESASIGVGTNIWAFTHVLSNARIGDMCNICDHVFIENDVLIGDRVTIKSGVQLWDGLVVADDVFIGPNVTFVNDHFPRSKKYPQKFLQTIICKGSSLGANATILGGVTIGPNAMIGAGSVVTRSVPANAIVYGNPARIKGYTDSTLEINVQEEALTFEGIVKAKVKGVSLLALKQASDMRGVLSALEFGKEAPFEPKRVFLVHDVPSEETRGEHAHINCHQLLIATKGSICIVVDDGVNREEFLLTQLNYGLYIAPMVWSIQYKYSEDAVLLVLASDYYDENDYIRNYDEFLARLSGG